MIFFRTIFLFCLSEYDFHSCRDGRAVFIGVEFGTDVFFGHSNGIIYHKTGIIAAVLFCFIGQIFPDNCDFIGLGIFQYFIKNGIPYVDGMLQL